MKKSKLPEAQIAFVLKQADEGTAVAEVCRKAGIDTRIGNYTFRATGITTCVKNEGTIEKAATMANHSSIRTTQLYDLRLDAVTLDEIERV